MSPHQRRRMEREAEAKAKVVASVWGAEYIQFLAALAGLPRKFGKKSLNSSYIFFQDDRGKIANAVRNLINSPPPQKKDATTFAFVSVSILLLWSTRREGQVWYGLPGGLYNEQLYNQGRKVANKPFTCPDGSLAVQPCPVPPMDRYVEPCHVPPMDRYVQPCQDTPKDRYVQPCQVPPKDMYVVFNSSLKSYTVQCTVYRKIIKS